ncbi:MAG TPA: hypothetical protein VHI10_16565, partial [Mycobacterium sp.]|nr:hypothetical protein [Mycobacterium sp.]
MRPMGEVFIGSEAVAAGLVTRQELRRWYRPLYRGIYEDRASGAPRLRDRATAAWLASNRRGVIAGAAASALHGAQWVDDDTPIELIAPRARPQQGLIVRDEALADDEVTSVGRLPVTTRVRTAFDLGRHLPRGQAIARLDSLMRAQAFSVEDVLMLGERYRGARGLKALRAALALVDGGAASPKETWLRLLYIDAGLPRPTTQIPIVEGRGRVVRWADMGWEEFMVVSEYDGDQHRTNRKAYTKDIQSLRKARSLC